MMLEEIDVKNIELIKKVNDFILKKPNIDVKQTFQWYNLRKEKKYFLYAMKNNEIIFCCNAFEVIDLEYCKPCLYIPRGPVFDENNINMTQCVEAICNFARKKEIQYVRINPKIKNVTLIDENKKIDYTITNKNDFDKMFESYREASLKINEFSLERLLDNFHYKTRYNIRKSYRNGLNNTISTDVFDLKTFYELYLQTAERHKFSPHPLKYFEELIKNFKENVVFCTVANQGKILAMSINIKISNTMYYLYGVSSNEQKNMFACYNLHWSMISYAKENEFEYYNFGGVFSNDDDVENKDYGLLIFKSRFCYNGLEEFIPDIIIKVRE